MCLVHIIDFVAFFTVDSPLLLETSPLPLLALDWGFFSDYFCHHLLGVGTPMVQFDMSIFFSRYTPSQRNIIQLYNSLSIGKTPMLYLHLLLELQTHISKCPLVTVI